MFARSTSLSLTLVALVLTGCGGGGKTHDRSARSSTGAPVTSGSSGSSFNTNLTPPSVNTPPVVNTTVPPVATSTGSLDPDNDGLTNDEEKLFGTDPNNPDTDGDGIMDGRDLAPLFGASSYGPFERQYPRGAVATSAEYRAAGLYGKSKVEKWAFGWRTTYEGSRSTRSSNLTQATVLKDIKDRSQQSDFVAVDATAKGALTTFDTYRYQKTVVYSRYTIDYDLKSQKYDVAFRNRITTTLRDSGQDAFATRNFPIRVDAGTESTVIVQFSINRNADRYLDTPNSYIIPACTYQVFDGTGDLMSAAVIEDDVAVGSVLHKNAYEVRLPLPKWQGTGTREWTVVVTPVWVSKNGNAAAEVAAINASSMRIGAVAHDMQVLKNSAQLQRVVAVFQDLRSASADIRKAAAAASFQEAQTNLKTLIQKTPNGRGGFDFSLSTVRATAAMAKTAIGLLLRVGEYTTFSKASDLLRLLSPAEAARYAQIVDQLLRLQNASMAVIDGMQAIVSLQQGDVIRATLYLAKSVTQAFLVVGTSEIIRVGAAAAAFATDFYEAVQAFRGGDNLRGALYVLRASVAVVAAFDPKLGGLGSAILTAGTNGLVAYNAFKQGDTVLGLVNVARGAGALARYFTAGKSIGGIPAGSVITAALGVIDVGYNVYLATKTKDPILRQRYVEDAVAAALDTAIMLIPTVGPIIQAVWQLGFQALSLIFPQLAKFRMFRSPGALLTFVGQVFFTNSIPSAYAEEAYEGGARRLINRADALQKAGEYVTVLFPTTT